MKHSCRRRDFLFLSVSLGLLGSLPVAALPDFAWALNDLNLYSGPLIDRLNVLLQQVSQGKMSEVTMLRELRARYADFDAPRELEAFMEPQGREMIALYKTKIKSNGIKNKLKLQLFFLPQGISHAPHAHEGLVSLQTLVQGSLRLREYERLWTEKKYMGVMAVTDTEIQAGQQMETSQVYHNVHWFGATQPAVIFNLNITRHDMNIVSDIPEAYSESRIYIDPTSPAENGVIVAPIMSHEEGDVLFKNRLPY